MAKPVLIDIDIDTNSYRIYSRISRGFLDNFLIKNLVGRGISVKKFLTQDGF